MADVLEICQAIMDRLDRIEEKVDTLIDRSERQAMLDRIPVCPCGWTGIGDHYHDMRMYHDKVKTLEKLNELRFAEPTQ